VASQVEGRELRLNDDCAAGWYNERFGDPAPGEEKVVAVRYRYGSQSPQEAATLPARDEKCALLLAPGGATVRRSAHTGHYVAEYAKTGRAKCQARRAPIARPAVPRPWPARPARRRAISRDLAQVCGELIALKSLRIGTEQEEKGWGEIIRWSHVECTRIRELRGQAGAISRSLPHPQPHPHTAAPRRGLRTRHGPPPP
jgi:hypothetical protein